MLGVFRSHLGLKLFAAHLVVVLVGVIVLASATEITAPAAYEHHMAGIHDMMGDSIMMEPETTLEVIGFRSAVREALLRAALAAFIAAVLVSLFVTRQVVSPIRLMMRASQHIAAGHYEERVAVPGDLAHDDIDELARLALSFNQMAAQLEKTETMRSRLLGDVAHELRTPLTTIKGTAEGLIDGVLAPEPEVFHQIHREADRLQRLVHDLQELSRVEAGVYELHLKPMPVETLLQSTIDRLKRQFEEKGVALETSLPPNLPLVLADEDRVGQILLNLVGNALQYTPPGGSVLLTVRRDHQQLAIAVRDTGIGIAAEHLPHVFTRFYRVDKSRSRAAGGSGIGLTIARHLVEAHGGTLYVESPGLNQGSIFTFTLPTAG